MNKPPAFQFYAKDWRSSPTIRSMTLAQKGVAIESMASSWDQDEPGSLPLPEEKAAKSCGIPVEIFKNYRRKFPKFWQVEGDKLVNPKLRSQWEELQQVRRSQSDAARRTNEKLGRKTSLSDTLSDTVTDTLTDPSASASASAKSKHTLAGNRSRTRATKTGDQVDPLFAKFWADYPRQIRRKETQAAWRALAEPQRIAAIEALASFKSCDAWQEQSGKFIPAPDRFLREGRWKTPPSIGEKNANGNRKSHGINSGRNTDFSGGSTVLPEL